MKNMNQISDKDFDRLFHDKFDAWEVEPSETVWPAVLAELGRARKRPFPVLWFAAASIAVVLGVGLWLSSHKEPMKLTGNNIENRGSALPEVKVSAAAKEKMVVVKRNLLPKKRAIKRRVEEVPEHIVSVPGTKNTKAPLLNNGSQVLPEKSVEQNIRHEAAEQIAQKPAASIAPESTKPIVHTMAYDEVQSETEPERGSKNSTSVVSSVVNYVIGRVDKRKDKIIELEDNDEGTKVKSLNLIVVKFKAKQ